MRSLLIATTKTSVSGSTSVRNLLALISIPYSKHPFRAHVFKNFKCMLHISDHRSVIADSDMTKLQFGVWSMLVVFEAEFVGVSTLAQVRAISDH